MTRRANQRLARVGGFSQTGAEWVEGFNRAIFFFPKRAGKQPKGTTGKKQSFVAARKTGRGHLEGIYFPGASGCAWGGGSRCKNPKVPAGPPLPPNRRSAPNRGGAGQGGRIPFPRCSGEGPRAGAEGPGPVSGSVVGENLEAMGWGRICRKGAGPKGRPRARPKRRGQGVVGFSTGIHSGVWMRVARRERKRKPGWHSPTNPRASPRTWGPGGLTAPNPVWAFTPHVEVSVARLDWRTPFLWVVGGLPRGGTGYFAGAERSPANGTARAGDFHGSFRRTTFAPSHGISGVIPGGLWVLPVATSIRD